MNLETLKNSISQIQNCVELDEIKKYLDMQIQNNLSKRENFMYRDYIDEYLYVIRFKGNKKTTYCKGNLAYEVFENDDLAYKIETKTKDLFPTIQPLMIKVNGKCVLV